MLGGAIVPRALLIISLLSGGMLLSVADTANAQTGVTVTAALFDEIKRFSGDPATNLLDGAAVGGSIRIGAPLAPDWRLTLGEEIGRTTTKIGPLFSPTKGARPRQDRTENRLLTTSVTLAFYPHSERRVRIGYLVGAAILHVTRTNDILMSGATVPNSAHTNVDNVGGLTLGTEAPVAVTRHLSVVPDMRVTAFRLSGNAPSAFAIEPGLGVRWAF